MAIIRSNDLRDLARDIFSARENDQPFTLFLGSGCARAAGVPDWSDMAMQFFIEELADERSWALRYMSPSELEDIRRDLSKGRKQLVDSFFQLLSDLPVAGRYSVLRRFFSNIPVPDFYIEIARLIRDGYFEHVITSGIDDLLEKALSSLGVARNEYQLVSLASEKSKLSSFEPNADVKFLVIKLHGDLSQQNVKISPEEIEDTLSRHRYFVKGELAGEMVMVGYNAESGPVEKWLTWTPGPLWWVNPEPPAENRRLPIEQKRTVIYIDGSAAQPARFFKSLSSILSVLELDWVDINQDPYEYLEAGTEAVVDPVPFSPIGLESAKDISQSRTYDDLQSQLEQLQSQIDQKQAVLSDLELKQFVKGDPDEHLQDNLSQTEQEIVVLEDQLRELTFSATLVLDLMDQVRDSAAQNHADPGALAFFDAQNNIIEEEYQRKDPSQEVLFATLSSVSIFAQLLGNSIIDKSLLNHLVNVTSMAGSIAGRRA